MQDMSLLKWCLFVEAVRTTKQRRFDRQDSIDFVRRPNVGLAFNRIGLGIDRGIETAADIGHLSGDPSEDVFSGVAVLRPAREAIGFEIEVGQL